MMIKYVFVFFTLTMFLTSCKRNENKSEKSDIKDSAIVHSIENLPDTLKDAIIEKIEVELNILTAGIENMDAQKIFSVFSNMDKTMYLKQGRIYHDISTAEKEYSEGFKESVNTRQKVIFTSKNYTILNEDFVIMTAVGSISRIKNNRENDPWVLVYSILWMRDKGNWKILNMHNSWR